MQNIPDFALLIGENDSGKTSLLEALRLLFEWSHGTANQPQVGPIEGKEYLWFGAVPKEPIKLEASVELTEADITDLRDRSNKAIEASRRRGYQGSYDPSGSTWLSAACA